MKLKRLLVMSMVALSILMVGCQNDGDSSDTVSTSSQSVSESMDNNINYETVPVPEKGWTAEELAKTIRINGKPIEMPFTIDSLGDKYLANEEETHFSENGGAGTIVYYDNVPLLTINYENLNNYSEIKSKEAYAFSTYHPNDENYELLNKLITINGVKIGASKSEVISILGEADKEDNSYLGYEDKSTGKICVGFFFDNKGKLSTFTVILN